jgi:hypothetical protein
MILDTSLASSSPSEKILATPCLPMNRSWSRPSPVAAPSLVQSSLVYQPIVMAASLQSIAAVPSSSSVVSCRRKYQVSRLLDVAVFRLFKTETNGAVGHSLIAAYLRHALYPSFEVTKMLLLTIWVLQGLLSPLHRWQLAASWWASAWVPQL